MYWPVSSVARLTMQIAVVTRACAKLSPSAASRSSRGVTDDPVARGAERVPPHVVDDQHDDVHPDVHPVLGRGTGAPRDRGDNPAENDKRFHAIWMVS